MSKVNVKKFFEELEKNPELKAKYLGVLKNEKNPVAKVIPFAKEKGFTFAESDLKEYCSELSDKSSMNSELSDEDLMKAAGGVKQRYDHEQYTHSRDRLRNHQRPVSCKRA